MRHDAVEVVGPEGAALAARLPIRIEHEMVDDELTAAGEELGQVLPAVRSLEDISLVHALPRQIAPFLAERVAQPRELLLPGKQLLARCDPLVARNDLVLLHDQSSLKNANRGWAFVVRRRLFRFGARRRRGCCSAISSLIAASRS